MRRLDTYPLKKLRNPARHLRALARWPERIADQLPDADLLARIHASGDRFWNYKVPVFSASQPVITTPTDAAKAEGTLNSSVASVSVT
ncbi:MAG: hypothetical protein EOP61_27995, partial [Sphingomonadales bacterium]